jgi:ribonuclease H2 subunit C
MLSIQTTESKKCTPNLLPARINHNGPINDVQRYWSPSMDENGIKHAHFRGRHLHGTMLPLPSNYTGAVLHITDKLAPQARTEDDKMDDGDDAEDVEEVPEEVKIAEQVGEFDELVVWGHGGEVEVGQDMFVRGMQEWIGFAEAMHMDEEGEKNEQSVP